MVDVSRSFYPELLSQHLSTTLCFHVFHLNGVDTFD